MFREGGVVKQSRDEVFREGEALYEEVAWPLERDHWGEYVAVASNGTFVVGPDLLTVSRTALRELGTGTYVFKVGEKSVGKLR
jgi:hypothetical protein